MVKRGSGSRGGGFHSMGGSRGGFSGSRGGSSSSSRGGVSHGTSMRGSGYNSSFSRRGSQRWAGSTNAYPPYYGQTHRHHYGYRSRYNMYGGNNPAAWTFCICFCAVPFLVVMVVITSLMFSGAPADVSETQRVLGSDELDFAEASCQPGDSISYSVFSSSGNAKAYIMTQDDYQLFNDLQSFGYEEYVYSQGSGDFAVTVAGTYYFVIWNDPTENMGGNIIVDYSVSFDIASSGPSSTSRIIGAVIAVIFIVIIIAIVRRNANARNAQAGRPTDAHYVQSAPATEASPADQGEYAPDYGSAPPTAEAPSEGMPSEKYLDATIPATPSPSPNVTMYCMNCGSEISSDSKFCIFCGSVITKE